METKYNLIGLDLAQSDALIDNLNDLLANYAVFYMNVRGFHWNIRGAQFFELHLKFQELYENLVVKIDDIAERVLTLGGKPTHAYSDFLEETNIPEVSNISDGRDAVVSILDSLRILLVKQRDLLSIADESEDEGTYALMSDYIREQEKMVWMYSAFSQI